MTSCRNAHRWRRSRLLPLVVLICGSGWEDNSRRRPTPPQKGVGRIRQAGEESHRQDRALRAFYPDSPFSATRPCGPDGDKPPGARARESPLLGAVSGGGGAASSEPAGERVRRVESLSCSWRCAHLLRGHATGRRVYPVSRVQGSGWFPWGASALALGLQGSPVSDRTRDLGTRH